MNAIHHTLVRTEQHIGHLGVLPIPIQSIFCLYKLVMEEVDIMNQDEDTQLLL